MSIYDLITKRYSVRGYENRDIPEDALLRIIEAARMAPSAANRQPWHIVVVRDRKRLDRLHLAYRRDWFKAAPVVIVICSEPDKAWTRSDGINYHMVDIAILMDHLILAATEEGLGTCWIAAFDPMVVEEALDLPTGVVPVIMTPLGYPAPDSTRAKSRKELSEIVHWNHW